MSDPDAPPLDEARIVEVLDRHQVDYVLVGGMGGRLHGATKQTRDFDVCPETGKENLGRLAEALKELGAKMRHVPDDLQPPIDAVFLGRMELGPWRTSAGDIDVLLGIPFETMTHLRRYPELHAEAAVAELAGCRIYVATLEHIIASKEAANRPSDLEALPELRALRAAELAGQAYPEGIEAALAQAETHEDRAPTAGEDLGPDRRYRGDDPPGPPRRAL